MTPNRNGRTDARPKADADREAKFRKPGTYIDLTDLVAHVIWYGASTGIQRVQLNTALHLRDTAVAFSVFDGVWVELTDAVCASHGNPDLFHNLIKTKYAGKMRSKAYFGTFRLSVLVHRILRRTARVWWDWRMARALRERFGPGDALVVLGAFWKVPSLIGFYEAAMNRGIRIILICHDMLQIMDGEHVFDTRSAGYMKRMLRLPWAIITVSDFTKQEIQRAIDRKIIPPVRDEPKVVRLAQEFPGVSRNYVSAQRPGKLRDLIGDKPYVLMVGSHEARKNHALAEATWVRLRSEVGDRLPALIFAGRADPIEVSRLNESHRPIKWYSSPTDGDLANLYANCLFTVFPSRAEGWGLPVGESLWFGKACASSNKASLPEVGGDLCCYFDPDAPSQFHAAVRNLLQDAERRTWEARIKQRDLRTWAEVYSEMAGKIVGIVAEP